LTDYKTILATAGFTQIRGCSCGGVRNDKYKKGIFTVYVRVGKMTFRIKQNNNYITASKPINFLHEELVAASIGV
jgi:hypothetical protein